MRVRRGARDDGCGYSGYPMSGRMETVTVYKTEGIEGLTCMYQ